MASLYILFSNSVNRYYVGITTEDPVLRVKKHNEKSYGVHYTSQANDWEIKLIIPCDSYSIARKMELYIKRMKSKKFVEKIIGDENEVIILMDKIKNI